MLRIRYTTNKRTTKNGVSWYAEKYADFDVKKIHRRPRGWNGRERNTYNYSAVIPIPDDCANFMKDSSVEVISEPIYRDENPHFKPLKMKFVHDVWIED